MICECCNKLFKNLNGLTKHFKVPKKNEGLVALQSIESKENQDFRYQ